MPVPGASTTRTVALERARAAVTAMEAKGLSVLLTGSLARGDFGRYSDVDFLITLCPREWKYRIESVVEDLMLDVPFDVIYEDELGPGKARLMRRDARAIEQVF